VVGDPATPASEQPPAQERRRGPDRRATFGRRAEDREAQFRTFAALFLAFCGGLALLYLFFALVGAVDLGDAIVATVAAIVLAGIWLVGVWQRARTGAIFVTRRDRERRGF
jgi:uncharacterized RDD family membrane protein YckC